MADVSIPGCTRYIGNVWEPVDATVAIGLSQCVNLREAIICGNERSWSPEQLAL